MLPSGIYPTKATLQWSLLRKITEFHHVLSVKMSGAVKFSANKVGENKYTFLGERS